MEYWALIIVYLATAGQDMNGLGAYRFSSEAECNQAMGVAAGELKEVTGGTITLFCVKDERIVTEDLTGGNVD